MAESTALESTPPVVTHQPNTYEDVPATSDPLTTPMEVNDEKNVQPLVAFSIPPALLTALASQLEYYFSPSNLRKDTYLRTIMGLNSGFVPTTVLATFANINRIIAQHDTDGSILSSFTGFDVALLIQNAVIQSSQALEVVVLDTQGTILARLQDYKPPEHELQITLVAVGPSNHSAEIELEKLDIKLEKLRSSRESTDGVSNDPKLQSTATTDLLSSETIIAKQQNTIILRDMPQSITSDDILDIFQRNLQKEKGPTVKDIHSVVGNCWFITLEHETTQELVSLLFALRDEKLPTGEPIKARLKTESSVKSPNAALSNAPSSSGSREVGHRGRGGSRQSGHRGNGSVYAGDRYNPSKADQHYAQSSTGSPDGTTVRRPYAGGGRGYGGRGSGGRGLGGRSAWSTPSSGAEKAIRVQPNIPPPPLVDEHFPTLAGKGRNSSEQETSNVIKSKQNDTQDEDTKKEHGKDTILSPQPVLLKQISSPSPIMPAGGYAAALLKATSPPKIPSLPIQVKSSNGKKNSASSSTTRPKVS